MLPPQKHTFDTIWGHAAARAFVPRLLGAGRLPHAILLTGPDAIGKRSLAFAMAKAILSAGKMAMAARMRAPGPAMAKRKVEPPPADDDNDAFGDDLFGDSDPEEQSISGGSVPLSAPAEEMPQPKKETPKAAPPLAVNADRKPPGKMPGLLGTPFLGYDERVCRLVESGYPAELDKDGRPASNGHLDLTIIEPIGNRRGILVDQMRALQDIVSVAPIEGAFRVVLIFGADTITQEGGNSMLKLLEEPPSYLVMILVANRLARVLPTIRSRCALVPMGPLPEAELVEKLAVEENLERDLAKVAAALAECRPGAALAAVAADLLRRRRDVFEARLQLDRFGICTLAAAASRINASGKLEETLWLLMSFTRDRMVRSLAAENPELLVHRDALDLLDAGKADPVALDQEADRLANAYDALQHPYVPNPRAVLQMALADLPNNSV